MARSLVEACAGSHGKGRRKNSMRPLARLNLIPNLLSSQKKHLNDDWVRVSCPPECYYKAKRKLSLISGYVLPCLHSPPYLFWGKIGTQSHSAKFLNWGDHVNSVPDVAVTPRQYVAGTHLYTLVREEKESGVKFLSKETTRRARLEPQTSRSGVRGVNHWATHASKPWLRSPN